ncbi:hypothetical protein [Pallidibacillus pasinlerensis]|uniref:Uncharacterized protein n=1 Tax=Pallidibacillus pasinlerensis TaxID=2703818 RepID=A0ABW9ZZM7_9BACI|nr:hypothetical protein [Pallidibacillus pasinlerensis]NCU16617.1 hypothetical protein [Pallidibacillus pasinlerensis]
MVGFGNLRIHDGVHGGVRDDGAHDGDEGAHDGDEGAHDGDDVRNGGVHGDAHAHDRMADLHIRNIVGMDCHHILLRNHKILRIPYHN